MKPLKDLLAELVLELRRKKLTVSFAESCTGGRLSAAVTEIPGISDIFVGSVISYANEVKIDLLGVRREALIDEGAVSEIVVLQMAQGVRQQLKTECSVAITGIAGPTGGSPQKPVGTVWFAACGPNFESTERKSFVGSRIDVQDQAVYHAAGFMLRLLNQSPELRTTNRDPEDRINRDPIKKVSKQK
ncbi:MAG: CinA family protein [Bdellovibrionales bacterium]|jgi:nicotinamide-nucleotide amidase|nr:CinA family protein [Bdellovibrionales bacterium]